MQPRIKNIVTVGGGTGSHTVLSGIKNIPNISITALVCMSDDGGSTGILRRKWNVMPGGDVRQCLAALSGKEFLNNRISHGFLKGHKIGNIFLAVLEKVTGDFSRGLKIISWAFNSRGKIIPITIDEAVLCAELEEGKIINGESAIDVENLQIENNTVKNIFYKEKSNLNPSAKEAILNADYIIIGPGNLYCSIIPNLITEGFSEAMGKSNAKIILLHNLVNKKGHTLGWGTQKYIEIIEKYLGKKVDIVLVNSGEFSDEQKERYMNDGGEEIFIKGNYTDPRINREDLLSSKILIQSADDTVSRSLIRHDSEKLAKVIKKVINKNDTKYIFDFDDVLFHTSKKGEKYLFKEHIFSSLEKTGIPRNLLLEYYEKERLNQISLKAWIAHFSIKNPREVYEEIMSRSKDFINQELIEVIRKIDKSKCFILTYGDKDFQLDKIKRSQIDSLFSEIIVVSGSKKQAIENICSKYKDENIYFIDDSAKHFDNLDLKKHPNLKPLLFTSTSQLRDALPDLFQHR